MKRIIYVLLVFMGGYFIVGCTHLSFKNTLKDTSVESISEIKNVRIKRVAIFPFADYSYQQDFVKPLRWSLNRKIIEELTDEFIKRGIRIAIQEDLEGLLISEGIIKPIENEEIVENLERIKDELQEKERVKEISVISPEHELKREHSQEMLKEIKKMANGESKKNKIKEEEVILSRIFKILSLYPQEPLSQGVTVSLSKNKIRELGNRLGVDAIVRGRIIEAGELDKTNPGLTSRGIIGFLLNPIGSFIVGRDFSLWYAQKEMYEKDLREDLLEAYSSKYLYNHPTGKRASVVQIRVYLQDVNTGEIIWSGRAEVKSTPDIFKEYHKGLFDKAIKKTVGSLMDSLFVQPIAGNRGYIYTRQE